MIYLVCHSTPCTVSSCHPSFTFQIWLIVLIKRNVYPFAFGATKFNLWQNVIFCIVLERFWGLWMYGIHLSWAVYNYSVSLKSSLWHINLCWRISVSCVSHMYAWCWLLSLREAVVVWLKCPTDSCKSRCSYWKTFLHSEEHRGTTVTAAIYSDGEARLAV